MNGKNSQSVNIVSWSALTVKGNSKTLDYQALNLLAAQQNAMINFNAARIASTALKLPLVFSIVCCKDHFALCFRLKMQEARLGAVVIACN
jgi:hypothetical protein